MAAAKRHIVPWLTGKHHPESDILTCKATSTAHHIAKSTDDGSSGWVVIVNQLNVRRVTWVGSWVGVCLLNLFMTDKYLRHTGSDLSPGLPSTTLLASMAATQHREGSGCNLQHALSLQRSTEDVGCKPHLDHTGAIVGAVAHAVGGVCCSSGPTAGHEPACEYLHLHPGNSEEAMLGTLMAGSTG